LDAAAGLQPDAACGLADAVGGAPAPLGEQPVKRPIGIGEHVQRAIGSNEQGEVGDRLAGSRRDFRGIEDRSRIV